ncbi:hypothetical protein HNY73_004164 [Argiope bruennichi]|uniref:Uncharacterized protein n=1 Tax=Argiope bruennichi TaxID=94029 RepID=A0A8T0FSC9_ARGBR|nr:hypothetical protein HNY73_004164 [Argiope bruennichi]
MSNYNGARRKTTVGNRSANLQSETGVKSKKYFDQNNGGDGWRNAGRRPLRSSSDDGWGEISRRPSNYTSDDLWGPLPSPPAATENAWEKRGSRKNQKSHTNQGKKSVPLVGPNFSWDDEYPALESRPPVENVWEKRKEKLEGRKAMEPTNQTEEELMIQKAIELSKLEAKEEEERRRHIEEEYELQNVILATNPQLFSDFLTPDELSEANKFLEPETADYESNDLANGYEEKESSWNYPEPAEKTQKQTMKAEANKFLEPEAAEYNSNDLANGYEEKESLWNYEPVESPQKQIVKAGKKRNKVQSTTHVQDEITTQNAWSDSQKFDCNKQNESILSEQAEYQDIQDNWSQNSACKSYCDKGEENESRFVNEGSDYPSTEMTSTIPEAGDESKMHKGPQSKISKVIDMFGGWGSKNIQNSSLKSSFKEERFDSYDNHSSADNKEIFQDDWEKTKEISELNENVQFSQYSSKHKEVENLSINEKGHPPFDEEESWNNKYSSNDEQQYNNELKHSLYSHVESNIAASSSFWNAATNSSDTDASYLSKKSVPKDDDIMNSIVQDYANLAVKCADTYTKENTSAQRKPSDLFNSVVNLLNEDNLKSDLIDLHHSKVSESENLSDQTAENEIIYALNNAAPTEFSAKAPKENISGSWNDSKIDFPTNSKRNDLNNGLFLPNINDSQDIHNDLESNSADSILPPPIQQEMNFPYQSNPVMSNFMNPNLMMGMNPLMIQQQIMMLNNPFFLQQLHQMEMYYRAMSMPFTSPLIHPMQTPPFNPALNNLMGSCFNGEPNSYMNLVPEQSVESNPSIPPPSHDFENGSQRSMHAIASDAPSVEFENSWLTDLISEGAAHMDSYIPPPTMPVTNPSENPQSAPNVENKVGTHIAEDISQNAYGKGAIPRNSNCDMKGLKQESSVLKYGRTDVNTIAANVNSVNIPKSSVPYAGEASGWGNIVDMPNKSNSSCNDDMDDWADEKVTASKSMIRSSIYASHKQANTRQPVRQPRQDSQWR